MNVIISQPRYMPFVPYLQRLKQADLFVFLDDVQRQGRGFENRNRILNRHLPTWLTIPICSSTREKIFSTQISNTSWVTEHKNKIYSFYSKHPYFSDKLCESFYQGLPLYEGNMNFVSNILKMIQNITDVFGFRPNYVLASSLDIDHSVTGPKHLADILNAVHADSYISGPNGKNYNINRELESKFDLFFHTPAIIPYVQPQNMNFIPHLAFIDELFCCGIKDVKEKIFSSLQTKRG